MKYLYVDGDEIRAKEIPETLVVAAQLLHGADYGKFDIDPIEASVLLEMIRYTALVSGDSELVESCVIAKDKLAVHVLAYKVQLEMLQ